MAAIGYYAPLRQVAPGDLLSLVQRAQRAGFGCAMCADHFHPRFAGQHETGHAWAWLGSAMATTPMPFGVVTCPFGRQHPAVVAQAAATLAEMHVDRFWLAVGTGEAVDERITGAPWPDETERRARLEASVEVMRALWRGAAVTRHDVVVVDRAQLYSRPAQVPHVFAAVCDPDAARWAARWAEGLVTTASGDLLQDVIRAFRDGGGEGKPVCVHARLSYTRSDDEAPHSQGAFRRAVDDPRAQLRVSSDLQRHRAWLEEDLARGADQLYLHNVHPDEKRFIDDFGAHVLPALQAVTR
jgi:G6PDH family F420-dependent oxidoreductase